MGLYSFKDVELYPGFPRNFDVFCFFILVLSIKFLNSN